MKVTVCCNNCGSVFLTSFQEYDGRVCKKECWIILQHKRAHSIVGKEYKPPQNTANTKREN